MEECTIGTGNISRYYTDVEYDKASAQTLPPPLLFDCDPARSLRAYYSTSNFSAISLSFLFLKKSPSAEVRSIHTRVTLSPRENDVRIETVIFFF